MNTPIDESAYRGGELTQLRHERDQLRAANERLRTLCAKQHREVIEARKLVAACRAQLAQGDPYGGVMRLWWFGMSYGLGALGGLLGRLVLP